MSGYKELHTHEELSVKCRNIKAWKIPHEIRTFYYSLILISAARVSYVRVVLHSEFSAH